MDNSKTIICPNCGAVSTNLDNCEYCGSILVKIASVLAPTSRDAKSELKDFGFGKTVYVSPKILEKVEQCIALSERLNITTYTGNISIEFSYSPAHSSMLKLCYDMSDDRRNKEFIKFENSQISKIFDIYQDGNFMYGSVALDNDTRTITQLIQYISNQIFLISDANLYVRPVATLVNNHRYEFSSEIRKPLEFVFDKNDLSYGSSDLWLKGLNDSLGSYTHYIKIITMKYSGWYLRLKEYSEALYDIVFSDPILRCKVDESYKDKVDIHTRLKLNEDGNVIWGSDESKRNYIAKCKEICSRSYYIKNMYHKTNHDNFGIINEDYDPQVYGPIEEYITTEENKIHKEAASEAEQIANEMQNRHKVATISNSGCLPILIPIIVIVGIMGYFIF